MSNMLQECGLDEELDESADTFPNENPSDGKNLTPFSARQGDAGTLRATSTAIAIIEPVAEQIAIARLHNLQQDITSPTETIIQQEPQEKNGTNLEKNTSQLHISDQQLSASQSDKPRQSHDNRPQSTIPNTSSIGTSPTKNKDAKEEDKQGSSQRTTPTNDPSVPPGDFHQYRNDSLPEQGSCEQARRDAAMRGASLEHENSESLDTAAQDSQNQRQFTASSSDNQKTTNPGSQVLRGNGSSEAESSAGAVIIPSRQRNTEAPSTGPEQILDTDTECIQQPSEELQKHVDDSIERDVSALSRQAITIRSNPTEMPVDATSLRDGIGNAEAQPQAQNLPLVDETQGQSCETPPGINNDTIRYLPTSPIVGIAERQYSGIDEPTQTGASPQIPTTSPLPPLPPIAPSLDRLQTEQDIRNSEKGDRQHDSPPRKPGQLTPMESLRSPVLSRNSGSPNSSPAQNDEREECEERTSKVRGDPCKPQKHKRKEDDGDESDLEKKRTPEASPSTIGKARKLSPSVEHTQPRKRRSCKEGDLAEGELMENPQARSRIEQQMSTSESPRNADRPYENGLQELTPSKAPDRPREYKSPFGMRPVSRLELPENRPEDPSPLGSGRRYQRTNMPPEYVPPNFSEATDSQEGRSNDEVSLTDESEAEDKGGGLQEVGEEARMVNESRQEVRVSDAPPASLPLASDPELVPIPSRNVPSENGIRGCVFPDIEAWRESPKVPERPKCVNQEFIRAGNTLIYRSPLQSLRQRGPPQYLNQRMTQMFGNSNVIELLSGHRISGGMTHSSGSINPSATERVTRTTNPDTNGRSRDSSNTSVLVRLLAARKHVRRNGHSENRNSGA